MKNTKFIQITIIRKIKLPCVSFSNRKKRKKQKRLKTRKNTCLINNTQNLPSEQFITFFTELRV